jgi:hypothetical protein
MAKKKKAKKRNPGKKPKHKKPRRRRNPPDTFMGRAGRLLGGAAVALAAGTAVLYGQGKILPGQNTSLYGVPAVGFLAGVALAKKMPTVGVGLALGSIAGPFAIPIASKILAGSTPSASTPALKAVELAAVEMGRYGRLLQADTAYAMSAVEMLSRAY